ncbi:cysteine desulfurase family protein [Algivirga pacifica]|uniref:cysteine desulfurase n=1 Tax=Algivirga pacifica TaxID=1162670 RepID=A0ABP9D7T1_9BACT
MKKVYLDNAATTPMDAAVIEEMTSIMGNTFGNPSSIHAFGRATKAVIEQSRKKVAEKLNALSGEIYFTSGGTESDNTAIRGLVSANNLTHIITTKIEHHAVGHTVEELERKGIVNVSYLDLDNGGQIDYGQLERLLENKGKETLVTLMHANNEIGTLLDLEKVGNLCEEYGAILHSDTVQTVGHYPIDVKKLKVHALVGSAHKLHGPKGVGFLYLRKGTKMDSLLTGGGQEREMRSGTENAYGIAGFAKALEIAVNEQEEHIAQVKGVKQYMIERLQQEIEGVRFNGISDQLEDTLYTVLNVSFPETPQKDMFLFMLDMKGIATSGGSACSAGAQQGSHVLAGINADLNRINIRFSFSKMTTKEEIDYTVHQLKEILQKD